MSKRGRTGLQQERIAPAAYGIRVLAKRRKLPIATHGLMDEHYLARKIEATGIFTAKSET